MRNIIILAFVSFLSACGAANIKPGDKIESGEGVLLTALNGKASYNVVVYHLQSDSKYEILHPYGITGEETTYKVISLPAGDYQWKYLFKGKYRDTFFKNPLHRFKVQAGKINYLCDISIKFPESTNFFGPADNSYKIRVYKSPETIAKMKAEYKKMFESMELVSAELPRCR